MDLLELFKHSTDKKEMSPGELLFSEGEPGDYMYVILEGEIEIVALQRVFEVAGPGSIVGEMALIEKGPRTAAARVSFNCEKCIIAVIDENEFLFMVRKMPEFSLHVMEVLVRRLREMDLKYN